MGSTPKPTAITLDIETLNVISGRLSERADTIRQVTLVDLVQDIRIAARACELLARIRFRLGELAADTEDGTTRTAIHELLDDASVAEPGVGEA
jgi:hypothetical protein